MADKDLRKLNRAELLELLLEQSRRNEALEKELSELQKQLDDKNIRMREAGNLAEASLALTGIFEEAQKAADLYLTNIRNMIGYEQTEDAVDETGFSTEDEDASDELAEEDIAIEDIMSGDAHADDIVFEEYALDGTAIEPGHAEGNMFERSADEYSEENAFEDSEADVSIENLQIESLDWMESDESSSVQDSDINDDIKTWIETHRVEELKQKKTEEPQAAQEQTVRKSAHKKAKPVKPTLTRKVKNIL